MLREKRALVASKETRVKTSSFGLYTPLIITICGGILISVVMLIIGLKAEHKRQQTDFQSKVLERRRSLEDGMALYAAGIESIEGLLCTGELVDRAGFKEFTKHIFPCLPGMQALEWIPRVQLSEREAYESEARKQGLKGFQFTEKWPPNRTVRASLRKEYFPVYYIGPYGGNEVALGYDLASSPALRKTMETACDTADAVATERITLVQEKGRQNGFLMFRPVFRYGAPHETVQQRRQNLTGFALGVFSVGDMVEATMRNVSGTGIDLALYDASASKHNRFLYAHTASSSAVHAPPHVRPQFSSTASLVVGQHQWLLKFDSTPQYVASVRSRMPWFDLLLGLVFTSLVTLYIRHIQALNYQLKWEDVERRKAEEEVRSSEHKLRTILDSVRPGILTIDAETHEIVDANAAALELIGASRDAVVGSNCHEFVCPAEQGQCPITDLGRNVDNSEQILLQTNGRTCPIIKNVGHITLGDRKYLLESFVDIRDLKIAQETLRQNEHSLEAVFDGIQDGISVLDTELNILRVNARIEQVFARAMPLAGKKCFEAFYERSEPCEGCPCLKALKQRTTQMDLTQLPSEDGKSIWLERLAFPLFDDDNIKGVIEYTRDITEKKKYEEKLNHMASHDNLTNLPNRLKFGDSLKRRLEHAVNRKRSLAILFIDLDRFKSINDTLGHAAGDQLLRDVSVRLRFAVRDYDVIARMGGDEFTLILDHLQDRDETEDIAKRIIGYFSQPFTIDGSDVFITVSMGISMFPDDGIEPEDLIKNADMAMYRAKEEGRNNYQFFDRLVDNLHMDRMDMQNYLRKAVERGELLVHYQPQLNVRTNSIEGCEALVRWRHPEIGTVMPDDFITLAEEMGFISDITEFVLFAACSKAKTWSDIRESPLNISVNVSAHELHNDRLIETVQRVLKETGLEPRRLTLEITESALAKKAEITETTIRKLKLIGVEISIDDFGTKYASLSLLKQFTVDCLKIDRSFVKNIGSNVDDEAIIEAVVAMAHKLGLRVTAEGVETSEQFEILKALDCDNIQGYLLGRPMSPEEFEELLLVDRLVSIR